MRDLTLKQVYASGHKATPTLLPKADFDAEALVKELKAAMDGAGTDESTLINILGSCSSDQRQVLRQTYKAHYGEELIDDLKSELSGDFEHLVVLLLYSWDQMYARTLFKAMDGAGTDEEVIVQLLCTLQPAEIEVVKETYKAVLAEKGKSASRNLESDIKSELGGNLEKLMVALLQCQRPDIDPTDLYAFTKGEKRLSDIIDAEAANQDAEDLYNAGEGKWGTDESTFISLFANRNKYSLWATNEIYKEKYGKSILEAVCSETSGDFKRGLKLLFSSQLDPTGTYAALFKKSMDGLGTSDKQLMFLVVDRCEIDLKDIMQHYEAEYGEPLVDRIASETSGDYKSLLLLLCGVPC